MLRRSRWRILVVAFGLVASMATPAAAVAHGYAHAELAEHFGAESHDAAGAIGAPDHEQGHAHAAVTGGPVVRWTTPIVAMPAETLALPLVPDRPSHDGIADPGLDPPPNPAEFRPSLTRAPPANR